MGPTTCDAQGFHSDSLTSTGVVSGTSLRMMMQRLWFGRTFFPLSSTCTMGEAATKTVLALCVVTVKQQPYSTLT